MKLYLLVTTFLFGLIFLFFAGSKAQAAVCVSFKTNCNDYTEFTCNQVQGGIYDGYYFPVCNANTYSDCNLCEPYGGQCGYCYHEDTSSCTLYGTRFGGYYPGCNNGTYPASDYQCAGLGLPSGYAWVNSSACYAPTCNSGLSCTGWSACGGSPTNTCYSGNGSQDRTCHYTTLAGGGNCNPSSNFTQTQSCTDYNCSANYTCTGGNCTTSITVHIYIDYGHDGSNDANYPYGVVTINGGNVQTTGADGTVTYSGLGTGTYTIAYNDNSADYQQTGATSQSVTLSNTAGNKTVIFRVTPLYTVSGDVFVDANHNKNYDAGDSLFTGTSTIHVSGGTTAVADMTQTDGTYSTGEKLWSGTYTFSQTAALPGGYTYTTPTSWTVTVGNVAAAGPHCAISTSPDAVCGPPNNGSISGLNFGIDKPYQISGTVFIDANHNKNLDNGETGYGNGTVNIKQGTTTIDQLTVNANGTYTTGQTLKPGSYTVEYSATLPQGYTMTTTNTWNVTVGYNPACNISTSPDAVCGLPNVSSISGLNFGVDKPYQISGTVFNDKNLNGQYDPAPCSNPDPSKCDTGIGGGNVKITGPINMTVTANASGDYTTGQVLLPGSYTVSYVSALPSGYKFQTSSTWVVRVGYNPPCSVGGSPDATCGNPNSSGPNTGSVNGLNFGLSNENTWVQGGCGGDIRVDSGYSQEIPSTADCSGTSAPYAIMSNATLCPNVQGILFSGNTDPSYGNGTGASTSNIVVGNSLFPELFNYRIPNTSDTSYSFLNTTLANLSTTPIKLTSICPNLTTCTLSKSTPGGVYITSASDGPVSLSVSNTDGSFDLGTTNYTFNIGGDLTFKTKLTLQNGYSAAFTSGGNIHAASGVGETNWASLSPDLEGFFSADGNFMLDTATTATSLCLASGEPIDRKLNIVGSVITGANGGGGNIINNRLGCIENLSCPTATFKIDPVQILHAPGTLKPPYTFWQELNP